MKTITISVRVHIKQSDIESLLCSVATGSSYWASGVGELGYESTVKGLINGSQVVKIKDYEDGEKGYTLDIKGVKRGLTIMAKKQPDHFADLLKDNADNNTSDVFLQCALLGDVLYG